MPGRKTDRCTVHEDRPRTTPGWLRPRIDIRPSFLEDDTSVVGAGELKLPYGRVGPWIDLIVFQTARWWYTHGQKNVEFVVLVSG